MRTATSIYASPALLLAAFLAISCGKKRDSSESSAGPPAWLEAVPPPSETPHAKASRAKFEARAAEVLRILHLQYDSLLDGPKAELAATKARIASLTGDEKAGAQQTVERLEKEIYMGEHTFRRQQDLTVMERKDWEAINWEGYPHKKMTTAALKEEERRYSPRTPPLSISDAGKIAHTDFWTRTDAKLQSLEIEANKASTVEHEATEKISVARRSGRAALEQGKVNLIAAQEAFKKARKEVFALRTEVSALAASWNARNWEGYEIPASPDDPPPKP